MQRARAFFYVCAGLFMLALSYPLGASDAGAQAPSNAVVAMRADGNVVVTANGDLYWSGNADTGGPFSKVNNVFSGGPVNVEQHSIGELKNRYR